MLFADAGQRVDVLRLALGARDVEQRVVRPHVADKRFRDAVVERQAVDQQVQWLVHQAVELGKDGGGVDLRRASSSSELGSSRWLRQPGAHHQAVANRMHREIGVGARKLVGQPAIQRRKTEHHDRVTQRIDLVTAAVGRAELTRDSRR